MKPNEVKLFEAAGAGKVKTVAALLAAGVDPNAFNERSNIATALNYAAQQGHAKVVTLLLRAGAKVDLKTKRLDMDFPGGGTALLMAIEERHFSIAHQLLDAGASGHVKCGYTTALSAAARSGDARLVKRLLEMDCDPNKRTGKHDELPLNSAVMTDRDQSDVVEVLLAGGAKPNTRDNVNCTALIWAAKNGLVESCRVLLDHGADPNLADDGTTPLMFAVGAGDKNVSALLISHHADINAIDADGNTTLDIAIRQLEKDEKDEGFQMYLRFNKTDIKMHRRRYCATVELLRAAGAKHA
jgi:ankyrin repeat protein